MKTLLVKVLIVGVVFTLPGCGLSFKIGPASMISDEADQKPVKIDKRLLAKCNVNTSKLESGDEDKVVDWADKTLKEAQACKEDQHGLVDWVKNTFKVKEEGKREVITTDKSK